MPLLKIATNKTIAAENRETFLKEASTLLSGRLNKSEQYVMTLFNPEVVMTFAGDDHPTAYLEIKSIGLTSQQSAELSAAMCQLVEDRLEIPQNRVYVEFSNAEGHLWGWNGTTF